MAKPKLSAIEKDKLRVKYKLEFFETPATDLKDFLNGYKGKSWLVKWLYPDANEEAKAVAAEEILADRRRRGERF